MSAQETKAALFAQVESITFSSQTSTVLEDAVRDYETKQPTPDQGDLGKSEEAWSLLANQVVGHETF
jgi:hypothetical protein